MVQLVPTQIILIGPHGFERVYLAIFPGTQVIGHTTLDPPGKKTTLIHIIYTNAVIFVVKQYDWGTELMFPKVSLEHPTSGFYL